MSIMHMEKRIAALALAVTMALLPGCGRSDTRELVEPPDIPYQRAEKETTPVVKGDRTYAFEHEITLAGYEEIKYRITKEKMKEMESVYDMKLDSVKVSQGDHVKAGQTLIAFSSKELDEQLRASRQQKELALLNLDHIRRVAAMDPQNDHSEQIKVLENECRVADQYVKDVQSVYSQFNVIAEKDGIISQMSLALSQGKVAGGDDLFTIVNGDGYYQMDMSMGEKIAGVKAEDFAVGDRYKARDDMTDSEYEFEVIAPPEERESETNMVFFKPVVSTDDFLGEKLTITGEPVTIKSIVYVKRKALLEKEDGTYVFVKCENGQFKAVKVVPGDVIGDDVMIREGLSGGEEALLL